MADEHEIHNATMSAATPNGAHTVTLTVSDMLNRRGFPMPVMKRFDEIVEILGGGAV